MNCIFMMLIEQICKLSKSLQVWSKKMESKVGIISHRQGKARPYLWDIELVNKKLYPASLLYFENLSYNDTLYSNTRKIFQCFETCKDIFTRHNVAKKDYRPWHCYIFTETFSSHWMQSLTRLIYRTKKLLFAWLCVNIHYIINMIKGY